MDWSFSARYVDTDVERARWRFTANNRVLPRLQVGVEFNAAAEEINPLVTWFLLTETADRPAVFLGTSSDRIGSPAGEQAYYATVSRYFAWAETSVYGSLNWSEWDEEINFPFGAAKGVGDRFAVRYMNDGAKSHLLLDHYRDHLGVSLMWVWLEQFGIALHGGF